MRLFRSREDSLKFGLSFFLIAGSVCGSIFCNGISDAMKAELLVVEQHAVTAAALTDVDFSRLLVRLLWKRGGELAVLLLMFAVPAAEKLRMAVMGYLGFSMAVMICPLTMDGGVRGLLHYIGMNFPQGIFYLIIGYLILWWMPVEGKRLTVGAICVLAVILCLGVVAETYINPWLLAFLFKK